MLISRAIRAHHCARAFADFESVSGAVAQDSSVPKEPIFVNGANTCEDIALCA